MADVVNEVVKAPKKALSFVTKNWAAAGFLILALAIGFVWYDTKNPGKLREKVAKIPGIGKRATGQAG